MALICLYFSFSVLLGAISLVTVLTFLFSCAAHTFKRHRFLSHSLLYGGREKREKYQSLILQEMAL